MSGKDHRPPVAQWLLGAGGELVSDYGPITTLLALARSRIRDEMPSYSSAASREDWRGHRHRRSQASRRRFDPLRKATHLPPRCADINHASASHGEGRTLNACLTSLHKR